MFQGLIDKSGGATRLACNLKGELLGITKHIGEICHFVDAHAYDTFRWMSIVLTRHTG